MMKRLAPLLFSLAVSGCIVIPVPAKVAEKVPLAITLPVRAPLDSATTPAPSSSQCAASPDRAAFQKHIEQATNALRAEHGLAALRPVASLSRVAQAHACDNAAHASISHVGSDGATLAHRLRRGGYVMRRAVENTGFGFTGSPERMMEFWKNSPGHRQNLLDPNVTELGFGLADGEKPAWVLVLAAPR